MSERIRAVDSRGYFPVAIWLVAGACVLTGLLVVYGVILPQAFTRVLALAGRNSVRFENPISATGALKELIFAFCFVFAAASASLAMRYLRKLSPERRFPDAYRLPAIAALSICIFAAVNHFGMRHFSPYDQSATLDLGWRLSIGQRPYGQFFNQFPPGHYLPLKFAFQLFGASWRAMVLLTALASTGAFIWLVALLRRITASFDLSVMMALAAVSTTGVMYSFWWYNPMTTLAGCIFLLSAIALAKDASSLGAGLSYLFALIIMAMMKPNLAAVLIILVTIVLLFSPARIRMLVISAAAFAAVNLILFLNDATIAELVRSYLSVQRTTSFFIQDIVPFGAWGITIPNIVGDSIIILLPLGMMAAAMRSSRRWASSDQRVTLALCAVGIVSGFLALATNMEVFISEGTLIILGALIVLIELDNADKPGVSGYRQKFVVAFCVGVVVYGTSLGAVRFRQWIVGPPFQFHEVTPAREPIRYHYFRGLTTGANFSRTMSAIEAVVKRFPHGRIFFDNTYSFASGVFNIAPLTIDAEARKGVTPHIWPMLVPPKAVVPGDSLDAVVCSYPCEEASRKLGFVQNDSLTIRATKAPFLSDVFVYTRPVAAR